MGLEPTDSGGQAKAPRKPIRSIDHVARFFISIFSKLEPGEIVTRFKQVNGQPGVISYVNDQPNGVITLNVVGDRIKDCNIS